MDIWVVVKMSSEALGEDWEIEGVKVFKDEKKAKKYATRYRRVKAFRSWFAFVYKAYLEESKIMSKER